MCLLLTFVSRPVLRADVAVQMADSKPKRNEQKCFKCDGPLGEMITVVDDDALGCESCYQKHGDDLFETPRKRRSRSKSPARRSEADVADRHRSRSRYRSREVRKALDEARNTEEYKKATAQPPRAIIWCGFCKDPKCGGRIFCRSKDDPECCAAAREAYQGVDMSSLAREPDDDTDQDVEVPLQEADAVAAAPVVNCAACKDPRCDGALGYPSSYPFRCPAAREAMAAKTKSVHARRPRATLRPHVDP